MVAAGAGILYLFKRPLEEAKAFQTQVAKFELLGNSAAVNSQAVKFAKSMNIVGTSALDAMRMVTEAQGVFRESGMPGSKALEGAKLAAPVLAKIAFATRSMDPDSQARMHSQALDMLRFVEMRGGLTSVTRFNELSNLGYKAIIGSGGNIDWSQLRQFMARGSVAAQGLDDTALFAKLEPIIGELKGGGAGQGLMTAYSRLVGNIRFLPKLAISEYLKLGLWDPSKVVFNSGGGIKTFKGNPLRDSELFSRDPVAFYEKYVHGYYEKNHVSMAERNRENALMFGNTGGKLFAIIERQLPIIARSVNAFQKTQDLDQAVKTGAKTLGGKEVDLQAKFDNLMLQLGNVALPIAIKGLEWLIPKVKWVGDFLTHHPRMFKGIIEGLIGLGAALVVGGVVNSLVALGRAISILGGVSRAAAASGALGGLGGGGPGAGTTGGGIGIGGAFRTIGRSAALMFASQKDIYKPSDFGLTPVVLQPKAVAHSALPHKQSTQRADDNIDLFGGRYMTQSAPTVQVNSTINLDGKKIATVISKHQANSMASPQTGMTGTDMSAGAPPIGLNLSPAH